MLMWFVGPLQAEPQQRFSSVATVSVPTAVDFLLVGIMPLVGSSCLMLSRCA